MPETLYFSLDEARAELRARHNDTQLRARVERALGAGFMAQQFSAGPRGVSFRQLCSPDNGFQYFSQASRYVGTEPLVLEYHDDIFVHFNEEKKGLGRLRVTLGDKTPATADIMDFHANEKRKLKEADVKTGQKLVDFHHALFGIIGDQTELHDNSSWFRSLGKASEYYSLFLLHFLAHGVLFETFLLEGDEQERDFTEKLILPTLEKIYQEFSLKPLIVRAYPDQQTAREDFYWWSYPPTVNEYIVRYCEENRFPFKPAAI